MQSHSLLHGTNPRLSNTFALEKKKSDLIKITVAHQIIFFKCFYIKCDLHIGLILLLNSLRCGYQACIQMRYQALREPVAKDDPGYLCPQSPFLNLLESAGPKRNESVTSFPKNPHGRPDCPRNRGFLVSSVCRSIFPILLTSDDTRSHKWV